MINLTQLATLVAIIDHGSFGAAATRLGITQPTASQHIKRLENQLGTALFIRASSRTQPTASALAILPHARNMLSVYERLTRVVQHPSLSIGASSNIGTYMIQPLIRRWLQNGHDCDMVVRPNPDIAHLLEGGEIDIGLMEWWDRRTGFEYLQWGEDELLAVVPPEHPWTGLNCVTPQQLSDEPLLGGEPGTGTGRLLATYLARHGLTAAIGMTFSNTEAVKRAVRHGLGVSLLLRGTVAEEVSRGELHAVPLADGGLRKALYAIWRQQPDATGEQIHSFRKLLAPPQALPTRYCAL
ncbi:DNA-binding transcriptional LysR family regulator [Methylohalomonas lacus]|uniref:DNA-binding transcriptional LysR family regulator n=1 Tax=Methylohalomonas lacus TaxID=398773 RepID=A0AAE3L411_9GAMM|nr:LysR family transcriptional regulator [Methylohalomonas lacus]MCS3903143.1 DNA-binding transcriptional LysR family regulator [Methylohalomonas lacus]